MEAQRREGLTDEQFLALDRLTLAVIAARRNLEQFEEIARQREEKFLPKQRQEVEALREKIECIFTQMRQIAFGKGDASEVFHSSMAGAEAETAEADASLLTLCAQLITLRREFRKARRTLAETEWHSNESEGKLAGHHVRWAAAQEALRHFLRDHGIEAKVLGAPTDEEPSPEAGA